MTANEVVEELKKLGKESIKTVLIKHGAPEPIYGVKVEDLKKMQKKIKKDYRLALDLYATGISDAMYLAGLIADDARMTRKDLQRWMDQAHWKMVSECTVPWVAAGNPHGYVLALEWIESRKEPVAAAGWATLSSLVSIKPDSELDLAVLRKLLQRVTRTIHAQPNRVRYTMNGFVIAAGCYVPDLTQPALEAAGKISPVAVDMGGTACQVPDAAEYIRKVQQRGIIGKKRKTAKC
jgi:3-methyladenine DNA glycosylase AlkD